jgi:phage terminase large subunit
VSRAKVSTGYSPRPLQAVLHKSLRRFNVLVCHRRFGKSVFSINHQIHKALSNTLKNPQYAYLAPTYGQAKRVAWDYFKEFTKNIPGAVVNEADLRIDIPRLREDGTEVDRIRFMLLGAENPMALKGIYLDGVILDEYAEMNPQAWREVIRPALSDRKGWAIFIGTPKGQNSFYEIFERAKTNQDPEWFGALYRASETGVVAKEELESAKKEMTEEEYEQEFECSFLAGLVGAYFAKEMTAAEKQGRIKNVPHDKALPVDLYWDLGINDVNSIWAIQSLHAEHRAIKYFEGADLSIPDWINVVKKENWNIRNWYLPHDAKVREMGTGKARIEAFTPFGIKPKVIKRIDDKLDSIHAARMIIPKVWFDAVNCKRGIEALKSYQRKWDAKSNVFSQKPLHNWASNGSDAFQQFAMGVDEREPLDARKFPAAVTTWDVYSA